MRIRWYQLLRAGREADAFWICIVGIVLSAPGSYLWTLLFARPDLAAQFRYAGVIL